MCACTGHAIWQACEKGLASSGLLPHRCKLSSRLCVPCVCSGSPIHHKCGNNEADAFDTFEGALGTMLASGFQFVFDQQPVPTPGELSLHGLLWASCCCHFTPTGTVGD